MEAVQDDYLYDVIIVGAGPAGLGVALTLQTADIKRVLILERDQVGSSFDQWPAETRFITPSFPTNSIGMLDLNSIAVGISPAFSLQVEHPNGEEFAEHLQDVASFFGLPIRDHTEVFRVNKVGEEFQVETVEETLRARHVIWAAGEFQYPNKGGFSGSQLCRHTATIESYADLEGDNFVVIGGYESGIDAAYHLAEAGKEVQVLDRGSPWVTETSDPSVALSTYSLQRMREFWFEDRVELLSERVVTEVVAVDEGYEVKTEDGLVLSTPVKPILANGF